MTDTKPTSPMHSNTPPIGESFRMNRRRFLQASTSCIGLAALRAVDSRAAENPPRSAVEIGAEPQLFLDDWIVDTSDRLKRTLHRPEKQGLIKLADGADWDLGSVYLGNIVCRDLHGRFHMTYRYSWWDPSVRDLHPSIGEDKAHWFRESIGYATSSDGVHWEKPRLGLIDGPTGFRKIREFPFDVPAGMSRDNNLGCPFDFAYDLHAHGNISDPDKRFLLRAVKLDDTHPFAKPLESQMYFAKDWPDLANDPQWRERLTPLPNGSLSPRGFKSIVGYDHDAKEWFAVSQDVITSWLMRNGRDIARYATKDLIKWSGPELALAVLPDESRDPRDWIEYMDMGAYRAGGPKSGAWLGQLVIFHSDRSDPQYMMPRRDNVWRKGTTEVRLVVSRDAGRSWQRIGGKEVWLPCSDDPHGYDRLVFAAHPVRVGDEAWFYYTGWNGDHLVFNRDGTLYEPGFLRRHRVARATMRWDGYVSLDAGAEVGSLVTRPFRFSGEKLLVNLCVPAGRLVAELQDDSGKPLEGFSAADAHPVRGDGVNLAVQWNGGQRLAAVQNRPIRLKFEVTNGALYGFRFSG